MTQPPQQPGQPGQYGQQTAQFGQPPGAPGTPPPRKVRPRVIIVAVVAAVLVLGAAITFYLMTRDEGDPQNTAGSGSPSASATQAPAQTGAPGTGTGGAEPPGSSAGANPPPAAPTGGAAADPAILDTANKYAKAVNDKDADTVKSISCSHDIGILFETGSTVEVTGQPEMNADDTVTVGTKVTVAETKQTLENFPMALQKSGNTWCVV